MTVTDAQVRNAIAAVIETAEPAAVIFNWNALGHQMNEWPGMFRLAAGGTHGWIIKRTGTESEWKGNGGRDRKFWIYDVWGFYGFRPGKEADNSDEEFAAILDAVYEAVRASGKLGLEEVEEHGLLQWQMITTIDCGEETLHFAQGRLRVMLCC